jgi:hypothetical protein
MRAFRFVVALLIAAGLAGCGSDKDPAMPDLAGKKLDVALSDIERAGFEDDVDVVGGGVLGIINKSNWEVCEQTPAPGEPLTEAPRLTVERDCDKDDAEPSESPSPEPTRTLTPTQAPIPAPTLSAEPPLAAATDITVDALLDKLNSANMGGIKVGDRFRFTGELFQSDLWGTGASGDYWVLLKAQGGKQDLPVFVEESDAGRWRDGTRVEMVVENVEVTMSGETSDGYLRAVSVKTL